MRMFSTIVCCIIISMICTEPLVAADGDTTKISAFSGKRFGAQERLDTLLTFPEANRSFAKIVMKLELACPCGPSLGEWDYTTLFYFKTPTGELDGEGKPKYRDIQFARYITPYGLGLAQNWRHTWTFDVTDYRQFLTDQTIVSVKYDGWTASALFTLSFSFIEGQTMYDVAKITQVLNGYYPYGNEKDPIDSYLTNKKFTVDKTTDYTKLRIFTTGHGGGGTDNAAEFAEKTHSIWINGEKRFDQHLWRSDCGWNPVYPQGGTWSIARAGWCPGDIVGYWDWDISPFVTKAGSGDSNVLDYKMQPFINQTYSSNPSGYSVTTHIIESNNIRFGNNASLLEIKAPNNSFVYNRTNPICGSPVLRIKNDGKNEIASIAFRYGVVGQPARDYTWNGKIAPMKESDAVLPALDNFPTIGTEGEFFVDIISVNGSDDEYALFNSGKSKFSITPKYDTKFKVNFRTNKETVYQQYFWEIANVNGEIVAQRDNNSLSEMQLYSDSVNLSPGCYEFRFINPSGFGLSWWYNDRIGIGGASLNFGNNGKTFFQAKGDCGNGLIHQFRVGDIPLLDVSRDTVGFGVVPVGESKQVTVKISPKNSEPLEISAVNVSSSPLVKGYSLISTTPAIPSNGSLTLQPGEELIATIEYKPTVTGKKNAGLEIYSNDFYESYVRIPLMGGQALTHVDESDFSDEYLHVEVAPSPADRYFSVNISHNANNSIPTAQLAMFDVFGNKTISVFEGNLLLQKSQSFVVSTENIPTGIYYIIASSGKFRKEFPIIITH